ncbi:unnamed protein product [Lathyrus oleraceus]
MEIQLPPQLSFEMLPPPPPPLSSSLEYISSPDNDSVEELPQLPSPPLPAPWRPQLPRVGGQLPPVGCLNRRQMKYLYNSELPHLSEVSSSPELSSSPEPPSSVYDSVAKLSSSLYPTP